MFHGGGGVVCRPDEEIAKRKLWTQVPSRFWGEDLTMIVSRRTGCRVVQWIVHARCVKLQCMCCGVRAMALYA